MFPGEAEAARECCELGSRYGYGNLISRMRAAWAAYLIEKYPDMGVEAACRGAWMPKAEAEGYAGWGRERALAALKEYACLEA